MSTELLRLYDAAECGTDGYPLAWREAPRIPDLVRAAAGHRCVRCLHPYKTKESNPEWSRCDEACRHGGPIRYPGRTRADVSPKGLAALLQADVEVEASWRVLTVHHLTGEKADCRWWNLAPLCQRCHLYIQGRVKMDQVYPYEHSAWFRPYAAGYYAMAYLGRDLSRPEVEDQQAELLALERVA